MEGNKFLQKARQENLKAEHDAYLHKLEGERDEMINTYENQKSYYLVFSVILGIVFFICLIWFSSTDKYTSTSFFFFSMDTISFSWVISLLLMIFTGIFTLLSVIGFINCKSKINELRTISLDVFQSRKDSYIFETKGLLGLLFKK